MAKHVKTYKLGSGHNTVTVTIDNMDELDFMMFMSPGPMHLYNFVTELLERFMVGIVFCSYIDHTLRWIGHNVSYEAYLKLIKPLCERYGVNCNFFHTDPEKDDMGRANLWADGELMGADSDIFQQAVTDAETSINPSPDILLVMLEKYAQHTMASMLFETRTYGTKKIFELDRYVRGPHPDVMNRVKLEDITDGKKRKRKD
jgi:hypothetical protein